MAHVPQHVIDKCKEHGIVPGAIIKQFTGANIGELLPVGPYSEWGVSNTENWISVGKQPNDNAFNVYVFLNGRWAEVITPAPQAEGLKEGDACECGPAMRAAIVELAKELDIPSLTSDGNPRYGMGMYFGASSLNSYEDGWIGKGRLTKHTPEAFIAKMRVTASLPKPLKIGNDTVKFNSGSITVGCTTITNDIVREITKQLKD